MEVLGIDFTSRPTTRKPITCLRAVLSDGVLQAEPLERWATFEDFERALRQPGPWIAGVDFPLGQSRRFIENIRWPLAWAAYVEHAQSLGREGFRTALTDYRTPRRRGDREHRRRTDEVAGSISPQKLYGVPVALMFFEGAPRLLAAGVHIPHLRSGDRGRIVVEAYPGVLARSLIARDSYKSDTKRKWTEARHQARRAIFAKVTSDEFATRYGLRVLAPAVLCADPTGDELDALLCAVQAAWAWTQRKQGFGAPAEVDALEGWIADPNVSVSAVETRGP